MKHKPISEIVLLILTFIAIMICILLFLHYVQPGDNRDTKYLKIVSIVFVVGLPLSIYWNINYKIKHRKK